MTKSEALYKFFNGLGMTAYPSTNVDENADFPYLTYENSIGNTGDQVSITLNLWFHTESEAIPNAKVDEIGNVIGMGGKLIAYDEGCIWIKRGTPWSLSLTDSDSTTKRRALNVTLEFI